MDFPIGHFFFSLFVIVALFLYTYDWKISKILFGLFIVSMLAGAVLDKKRLAERKARQAAEEAAKRAAEEGVEVSTGTVTPEPEEKKTPWPPE